MFLVLDEPFTKEFGYFFGEVSSTSFYSAGVIFGNCRRSGGGIGSVRGGGRCWANNRWGGYITRSRFGFGLLSAHHWVVLFLFKGSVVVVSSSASRSSGRLDGRDIHHSWLIGSGMFNSSNAVARTWAWWANVWCSACTWGNFNIFIQVIYVDVS